MDTINLLAGTGAKTPTAGKGAGNLEHGTDFASVLQTATSTGTTVDGLTRLAISNATVAAHTQGGAGKGLRAKAGAADSLASTEIRADGKSAPEPDLRDALKPDAKDAQKTARKDDHGDKGKHARGTDALNPSTPIAAAIHSALAAVPAQAGKNATAGGTAASSQRAGDATPGKANAVDARGNPGRHQLQSLQQTAVTSSAASNHAGSDTDTSSGGNGFASRLLAAADAPARAPAAVPGHGDNGAVASAINSMANAPVAPHAAVHANAPATISTATLQAPIGSTPWQNELGQQLIRFGQRGEHQIELHLHPKELGPLQISLHVDDQVAQAHFFAAHAQVRDAVQQAIPQLREALAGQGIALGEAMVGQQQQQRQDSGRFTPSGASSSAVTGVEAEGVAPVRAGVILPRAAGSGVDLYA